MITFAIFVWFTMKFVWPPIMKALGERQDKIAEGLAAAERGHKDLDLARQQATEQMREAKGKVAHVIDQAQSRANQIIDEAKQQARVEAKRVQERAKNDIDQAVRDAKVALQKQVASVAINGAEKILAKNIDEAANRDLIDKMIEEI